MLQALLASPAYTRLLVALSDLAADPLNVAHLPPVQSLRTLPGDSNGCNLLTTLDEQCGEGNCTRSVSAVDLGIARQELPYWSELLAFSEQFRLRRGGGGGSGGARDGANSAHMSSAAEHATRKAMVIGSRASGKKTVSGFSSGGGLSYSELSSSFVAEHFLPKICRDFQLAAEGVTAGVLLGGKPRQQDACEFLTFLLDVLHEELVAVEQLPHVVAALKATSAVTGDGTADDTSRTSGDLVLSDEHDVAISREESGGSVQEEEGEEEEDADGGWNTVPSKSKSKEQSKNRVKSVMVDDSSRRRAQQAGSSSAISAIFHGTLR